MKKYSIVTLPDLSCALLNNMRGAGNSLKSGHPGHTQSPLRPPTLSSHDPLPSASPLRSRSPLRPPTLNSHDPLPSVSPLRSRSPLRPSPLSSHDLLRSGSLSLSHSPLDSCSQSPLCNVENVLYNDTTAFRKFMVKSITTLLKRTENIDVRLKHIEAELSNKSQIIESEDEAITLPLKSVEDIEEFEEELKNKQTFNKMIQRMKFCSGKTVNFVVNSILKKLFTNELAAEFSWHGKKGKKPLNKLIRLTKLIKKAVQVNCSSSTDNQIETSAGYWLAQANIRIKRQK
ncbi:hypothetical protein ABEB36_014057 [Hypothenemus hampei]|uniref:DUF4806 domain-containing protein n=1 Tax=Hypothenemus hampei TaxID=57062 RepID=A0ABD1E355_HYPHA